MKRKFSASVSVVALTTTLMVAVRSVSMGQSPPPIGGGYTNVIAIPVNDPAIKAIARAASPSSRGRLRSLSSWPLQGQLPFARWGGWKQCPGRGEETATIAMDDTRKSAQASPARGAPQCW
jgi:hypothetical protein